MVVNRRERPHKVGIDLKASRCGGQKDVKNKVGRQSHKYGVAKDKGGKTWSN